MTHGRKNNRKIQYGKKDEFRPHISMVVSAYNEEKNINGKIENFLSLDYPKEKIELLIGSDGSTDKTAFLIQLFKNERIRSFNFTEQKGKISVLNDIVRKAKGEIIVFSDAETRFEKNAILKIVRHFSNNNVGGVCGKLELHVADNSLAEEGFYWRYENFIKEKESQINSIVSINGQIFAVRKNLFEPLPENIITEDQVLGMKILSRGYHIRFDSNAIAEEKIGTPRDEFRRRVRISAGNFQSIAYSYDLLNPDKGFLSFALWSHKILRWLVPFFLISIFIISFILSGIKLIGIILLIQIFIFLVCPLIWLMPGRIRKNKLLSAIIYFDIMNLAVLLGFIKFLFKKQKSAWKS